MLPIQNYPYSFAYVLKAKYCESKAKTDRFDILWMIVQQSRSRSSLNRPDVSHLFDA